MKLSVCQSISLHSSVLSWQNSFSKTKEYIGYGPCTRWNWWVAWSDHLPFHKREPTVFSGQEEISNTLAIQIIPSSQSCWVWGYHNGGYEEFYLLAHSAVSSGDSHPIWRWRWYVPPKHSLIFTEQNSAIFQKTELFNTNSLYWAVTTTHIWI
jgi:hypothetical protein